MTQTQQKFLISIIFIALIAGLIVSLNVDDQDTQSGVSVITPSNANTSVDNRSQATLGNTTNTPANTKQTQDPFNPNNNQTKQVARLSIMTRVYHQASLSHCHH
ncbi:hypothetical protein BSPWISOXPB_5850 [uncultured Gammaproteobacteria bacterium]|nr:hypothetical protein BSPWISOXPB_5850 [uncultured Gammaproteobacteria bacterium]